MAKKILGLANFKKVHEDANSATLKHPDGHEIKISKAILSPKHAKELQGLPLHASDGNDGDIIPEPAPEDQQNSVSPDTSMQLALQTQKMQEGRAGRFAAPGQYYGRPQEAEKAAEDVVLGQKKAEQQKQYTEQLLARQNVIKDQEYNKQASLYGLPKREIMAQGPDISGTPEAPQADEANFKLKQPQGNQSGMGSMLQSGVEDYEGAVKQQEAGVYGEAKAMGELGRQKADLYDQNVGDIVQHQQNIQNWVDHGDREFAAFKRDVQNDHINPDRYVQNMSGGQKIATALGLILGGIGGGITHTANPAEEYLNNAIKADIDSQKNDQSNKQNLYKANVENLGNHLQAEKMTYAMSKEMMADKLEKAANLMVDPIKKNQAMQAVGKIRQDAFATINALKMQRGAIAGLANGPFDTGKVAVAINQFIPKEARPKANEELGQYIKLQALHKQMSDEMVKLSHKALNGALSPSDTESAKKAFTGLFQVASEHRYNHEAAEQMVNNFFGKPLDFKQTVQNKARRMDEAFNSLADTPTITGNLNGMKMPAFHTNFGSAGVSRQAHGFNRNKMAQR